MLLIPHRTPILAAGDNLVDIILDGIDLLDGDILAVSSKAIAMCNGEAMKLDTLTVTDEARTWSDKLSIKRDPAFRQAVLNETARMHGRVLPSCAVAMLTELRPDGFPRGVLLVPNAGLDLSNVEQGYAIGWPKDPVGATNKLREDLEKKTGKKIAVILTDSGCRPRREGVTAIALTVSGMDPVGSRIGTPDLFGQPLHMTQEATADQLATAANFIMGNAAESTPVVIIRHHDLPITDYSGWVPGIEPKEDLFQEI